MASGCCAALGRAGPPSQNITSERLLRRAVGWSINSRVRRWTTRHAATGAKFSRLEDHNISLRFGGRSQRLCRLYGAEHITVEPDVRWKSCELMELSLRGLRHLLPLHFVLLFFPALVSTGHSWSLLSVQLGIVMSEASLTGDDAWGERG